MSKNDFIKLCAENGIPEDKATLAWDKIKVIRKYIREHWDLCKNLQRISERDQLHIRQIAAEKGIEWTPDEIKMAISVLGKIQNRMRKK